MFKGAAIALFGRAADLARALDVTPQAIYQWPDELDQERVDRVMGAALRLGKVSAPDVFRAINKDAAA